MRMHEAYDSAIDEGTELQLDLEPCPYCERKFSKLSRHVKVCRQLSSKKTRPVFDSSKQRLSGISEQDKCLVKPVSPLHLRQEQKEPTPTPAEHPPQEKIWNRTKSYVMGLKDKFIHPKVKPRSNSISAVQSEPPRAKSETTVAHRIPDTYVQCPSCDRWFGPKAADRHIEWCTSKIFRMPAGNAPCRTEKKRWESRTSYKAPLPGKARLENRQKYGFGAPEVRLARGFSPPKAEISPFDRSGPRRTSLRGRRFGEPEDPLAYALGRQESPPRKQQVRRFLSSSAYRAEPDGIDHAVLSKSSKTDGYEIHRSLLHENAARQLEELLMSSSSCSLAEIPMSSMSQSMHAGMDLGISSSSLLMSTSLGPDSRHFMTGSPFRSSFGAGKSRIPRRSPSPHGPTGPASLPSDEFLLNELMASDLLTPPQVKASGRKQACPPPSLQEMLYGGQVQEKGGEKGLGGAGFDDEDEDKRESTERNEESEERRSQEGLSSPASTSSKASVIEATSAAQLVARQGKRESADGFTATTANSQSFSKNAESSPVMSKSNGNQILSNLTNHPSSIPDPRSPGTVSVSNSGKPMFPSAEAAKPSLFGLGSGKSLFAGERREEHVQPSIQFSSSSASTATKAKGLPAAQLKSKTQELFSSGLLGFESKPRLSKMTNPESDDDVIAASHNVVTNIASEMGSLALFDSPSSRLHRPSPSGSNAVTTACRNYCLPQQQQQQLEQQSNLGRRWSHSLPEKGNTVFRRFDGP